MEVEPPPSISGALNPTSLKAIIHACRAAKTNREQFAYIRKMIAMVNTELRTIQTKMQPFAGATAENPVDCFYEVDIYFLCEPPFNDKRRAILLAPSNCNKIEISLSLVNARNPQQRFQVGTKTQMLNAVASRLSVNSLPDLSPESFSDTYHRPNKKPETLYAKNQTYFSQMGIGGLLFTLSVIVMAMAKKNMRVAKFNKNTDRLCAPYEVISDYYDQHDADKTVFDWKQFDAMKKHIYERVENRNRASKSISDIKMSSSRATQQFEAYLWVMTDNVIAYAGQLKEKMEEKTTGVNLVRTYVPFCVYYTWL
tara:strand:- start:163 stop:1095 length:933 start_codon:yes stop_codon:yes gene_type:complete